MGTSLPKWLAVAGVLGHAAGQTMTAKNYTNADAAAVGDNYVNLAVSRDEEMVPLAAILPLTRQAYHGIPVSPGRPRKGREGKGQGRSMDAPANPSDSRPVSPAPPSWPTTPINSTSLLSILPPSPATTPPTRVTSAR